MSFIIGLDQGTTSSRAILFDKDGKAKFSAQKPFKQHFPQNGWVEHDALEILDSQIEVARRAIEKSGCSLEKIDAIGITNQRETVVIWDKKTGKPIHNAIVWQDRRTADYCDKLKQDGAGELIGEKTGLVIDPYFSATKIKWLLDNVKGVRRRAKNGELAFGTIDTWLVWNLTGGRLHITDSTNASRTLIYNIKTGKWDDELLELFDIPPQILPQVRNSSEVYGETNPEIFGKAVAIAAIAGDQQAALFGQSCFSAGLVKTTYGTGCFILQNTGENLVKSKNNLLSTVAWQIDGKITYALEGGVFMGGATVQWLRDGLGIIKNSKDIEKLAAGTEDNGDVYMVPAFAGLGAPLWDPRARGIIVGLSRATTKAHIARAALEGIAHQVTDVLEVMRQDSGKKITEMRVDGGASANNILMQFQADMLNVNIVRPQELETTALGAARLAGLAIGWWNDLNEIKSNDQTSCKFAPQMQTKKVQLLRKRWNDALWRAGKWAV